MRCCWRNILEKDTVILARLKKQSTRQLHTNTNHQKATVAPLAGDVDYWNRPKTSTDTAYEKLDLSFENAQEAYKSKTNWEILRSLFVFKACGIDALVRHQKKLLRFSRRILGKTLFQKMMKATFYGQFVAGEDEDRIRPTINRNRHFGVKSILDYSVEKDLSKEEAKKAEMRSCVSEAQPDDIKHAIAGPNKKYRAYEQFGDRREFVTGARTYFYMDEEHCDHNMEMFLRGIDAVSGATQSTGFAAVKLTALGRPQFLLQLSEVLARIRQFYDVLAGSCGGNERGTIRQADFERYLKSFNIHREERKRWFTILDITQDGEIDLLDWHNLLEVNVSLAKLLRVPNIQGAALQKLLNVTNTSGRFEPLVTSLTDEEEEQMKNMLHRMDTIASYGKEKDVRVMVDAEQTYLQVAINRLTMEMMRNYNKEKAIIFNTYQCYLKEACNMISSDLSLSMREDFYFGAKLVRGAYMEQERKRAQAVGYEDPICPNYDATSANYEKVLTTAMEQVLQRPRGKIAIMIASHNEDTIRLTVQKMKEMGIRAEDRIFCFGQLLGMCDQVSFTLGQAGYSVYKYVPYGPVEEVIPYLSRRAQENRGVIAKVQKEKQMMRSELWRRLKTGRFLYDPLSHPSTPPV